MLLNMLSVISRENKTIRTIVTNNTQYYVVKDLAEPLGMSESRMRKKFKGLDNDEKLVGGFQSGGQLRNLQIVTEPGLINLIISCPRSRKQGTPAYNYRRWVTHEVLPSIHRTGEYRLEIEQLTQQVSGLTIERNTLLTERNNLVTGLNNANTDVLTRSESPIKILVRRITGNDWTRNWTRTNPRAIVDEVWRIWRLAKNQNLVRRINQNANFSFTTLNSSAFTANLS